MALKVGVVGVGNIGNIHADIYKNNPKQSWLQYAISLRKELMQQRRIWSKGFLQCKGNAASGIHLDACSMATAGAENGGDHFVPTMELLEAEFRFWVKTHFKQRG